MDIERGAEMLGDIVEQWRRSDCQFCARPNLICAADMCAERQAIHCSVCTSPKSLCLGHAAVPEGRNRDDA
jgi:hypothetical protein